MAFRDFEFPDVQQALGVSVTDADLFPDVAPAAVRADFAAAVRDGVDLAVAINTEKARSEFIIAPVLFELRRSLGGSFSLFSGVEFNVDAARGLNGYCDFILSRSPRQIILSAPLVAVTEAKNDNLRTGFGQCIAAMVAAHEFNRQAGTPAPAIYGVVTTGTAWKFLRLRPPEVAVDIHEYYIVDLGRILGILTHIIRNP